MPHPRKIVRVSPSPLPPAARTAGRVFAIVLGVALLLGAAAAVWIGVRAAGAYTHIRAVQTGTAGVGASLAEDPATALARLQPLAALVAAAHELTSDPIWAFGESLPWIGPQLSAFATVAAATDEMLGDGLQPIAAAAGDLSLDTLRPVDGRIDTSGLSAIAEPARQGADAAAAAAASVQHIDTTPLLGVVAGAVTDAGDQFSQVAAATDALARTATLLPKMLGADGPRDYLVLVQNNAEWRSLGGIVGAGFILHADGGQLSLTGTFSSRDFRRYDEPVTSLSDELIDLYDTKPAQFIQNVTQVPDFSVGAPIAVEMARRTLGVDVTGVVAVDPVVLSYLLEATGPITLPTGDELSADNAVPLLLNDVYFRYERSADQDAFFAAAAAAVFQDLTAGGVSSGDLISALSRAASERRLLLWSAVPDEEAVLAPTTLAGGLPVTDNDTARFGVYLNDGGGSKMSYYTVPDATLTWQACQPAGVVADRTLTLTLSLTSTAPADAATSLPAYITADGWFGVPAGETQVVGEVYLPTGYDLVSTETTAAGGFGTGTDAGHDVVTFGVRLLPGETQTMTIAVRATTAAADAEALVTPTADASLPTVVSAKCGGLD